MKHEYASKVLFNEVFCEGLCFLKVLVLPEFPYLVYEPVPINELALSFSHVCRIIRENLIGDLREVVRFEEERGRESLNADIEHSVEGSFKLVVSDS